MNARPAGDPSRWADRGAAIRTPNLARPYLIARVNVRGAVAHGPDGLLQSRPARGNA